MGNEAMSSYEIKISPIPDFEPTVGFGLLAVGDFDGDGDVDILRQTAVGEAPIFIENTNGTFSVTSKVTIPAVAGLNLSATNAKVSDFDSDGDLDIYQQLPGAANDIFLLSDLITPDTTPPTATIVVANTALRASETAQVTITFSEAVTGFNNSDLAIEGGTLSAVASTDNIVWTATFTPSADLTDATNVITLANTGVTDAVGNAGTGTTTSNNYAIDAARPTATIVVADTFLTAGETSQVTITFSEAVTGFTLADLTVQSGTLSALTTADNIVWTATLTPAVNLTDATNVITLANTGIADAAGNAGAGATVSSNYVIDTAAPAFASATVNGTALVLTYDEALDAANPPPASAFAVQAGGASVTINAVAVDASTGTVTLTLASGVANGQAVTVAYTDPTAGNDASAIQDAAGNDAASLPATSVTNNTPDTTPPVITAVSIPNSPLKIGDTVTANITVAPDADTYTLQSGTIGGYTLGGLTKVNATTYTATFTITPGSDVAAAADLAVNLILSDTAGSSNAAYTTPISQNADAIDATRPVLVSSAINGSTLVLTYSEALDAANPPAANAFVVQAGGSAIAVTSVAVDASAKTVTLTLAAGVANAQAVTVAYTDPTAGNDAAAIQDTLGNDAASLPATSVTNNTPAPPAPPTPPTIDPNGPLTQSPGAGQTQTLSNKTGGSLTLDGPGTLILTGTNTYTGPTTVQAGTLLVNGSIVSPTTVKAGGTLGGSGQLGTVTIESGGTLSPGNSPGILSTKDLTLAAGAILKEEIGGTASGQFDQLKVDGSVDVSGAKLDVIAFNNFASARFDRFVIIDNDGTDAIRGSFAGLAEGGTLSFGARSLRISYQGGDGNDVTLTDTTGLLVRPEAFGTVVTSPASTAGYVYGLYEALLNRAPDPLGLASFAAAVENGASLTQVASAILASAERGPAPTSLNAFVESLYVNLLDRPADAAGLQYWTAQLSSGASQASVAVQIATSGEASTVLSPVFSRGVFVADTSESSVARLYHVLLERAPDAGGLQAFSAIVETGGGGAAGEAARLMQVATSILASPEYTGKHGGTSDAAFIAELYQDALGRAPDTGGQAFYLDALSRGASRTDVALAVTQSPEAQVHLVGQIELGQYLAA
ncbi:Ig-like domain-containing protein [Antarcticirhabdus aurantiaca]|nr:Ig-like domain-containing protein [Antarcticirhabdus aurantiaca]